MIKELNDDDILDFLMTSEFEGDYKPEEFKYLLNKWRYFYRLLYGINERIRDDNNSKINELENKIKTLESEILNLKVENANKENKIDSIKNRKLTIKERLSGKIITK